MRYYSTGTGTMMASHTGRSCVRCDRELTDAASMEVGIGPICRRLDNAILAARIPSNIFAARTFIETVNAEMLDPQTRNTYAEVANALYASDADSRLDWRKEVKRLEWLLSFEASRKHAVKALTEVVRALGYVGLANLWEGKASTGVAKVRVADGRIYISGPRNMTFRAEVKKIPGWRFTHRSPTGSGQPEWSVPVAQHARFGALLLACYPNCADRDAALKEAADQAAVPAPQTAPQTAHVAPQPPAPAYTPTPAPVPRPSANVRVEAANGWYRVFTPYNGPFIAALKTELHYQQRRWDAVAKCWEVEGSRAPTLQTLLETHFRAGGMVPASLIPPAPAPVQETDISTVTRHDNYSALPF